MGFINGLGRMIQGKPVFQAEDQLASVPTAPKNEQAEPGAKVVPKLCVVRTDCRINGESMDIYAHIKNESSVEVYLDNIRLLDKVTELDRILKPGEVRDFVVYKGQIMKDESKTKCELKYRKQDGDFFVMQHVVEYGYQNETYVVNNIRPIGAVNDI